jgi:hypothetical protein
MSGETMVFTVGSGEENQRERTIVVKQEGPFGIAIFLEGCGMNEMEPGSSAGAPIYIEFYDGKPRCLVWADINNPDPTDVIEMESALEQNRVADNEHQIVEL